MRESWETGDLSTTKAACALRVATIEADTRWRNLALETSSNQLAPVAATYRRNPPADQNSGQDDDKAACPPARNDDQIGLWWRVERDGVAELTAKLHSEDAAVVRAALEAQVGLAWRRSSPDTGTDCEPDHADSSRSIPRCRRMADALVAVAATALEAGPIPIVRGNQTEVILHVDHNYLAGNTDTGRSHLADGQPVNRGTARRLACDARIRALVHGADGSTVDLGRSQRLVSDKQRRLLTERDHGCRFPGCTNFRYVDAHHVIHWEDGGPTDLDNLMLLCNLHHRLHHQGDFDIRADGKGDFTFTNRWHQPIGPPRHPGPRRTVVHHAPGTTRARSGGDPRLDINLAVTALTPPRQVEHA